LPIRDGRRWAALSPLLLYQFGWNLHEDLTQTIVLTCAVVAGTLSVLA